ncbi:MAG TPA: LuxR C-terminal-related transcriptional regulator [Roseiflexaceae bacterium]|nr:LuxR C-terminal-related transcriptional regulator [Roseiflexaceae bacterium]
MPTQGLPLLRTKLDMPPRRAHTLARERLLALVPTAPGTRLVLLCAPAGFGKTTFLASWCHTLAARGAAIAWVALDDDDNDPNRFWAYLSAAIDRAMASTNGPNDDANEPWPRNVDRAIASTQLINALATLDRDLVLVLDDYQAIATPAIHAMVAFLIEHLPDRVRLAIGSRADPPLPLARLRAREQLVELRAAQLRFTPTEIQEFFQLVGRQTLAADEACAIGAYAEGWPAGVQLTALALQSESREHAAEIAAAEPGPALEHTLARLDASQRYLFAYLADDVFERQPPHIKRFLLQTAILDRMCAPLCDAVLGLAPDERPKTNDEKTLGQFENSSNAIHSPSSFVLHPSSDSYSRLVLEAIEHANLFVIPLDPERHWYRYHHLFHTFLRARLAYEPPDSLAELHRRASWWFERQQLLPSAVEHALAAGDPARAADQIEAFTNQTSLGGEYATLRRWLERIPESVLAGRPALCLQAAWAALLAGDVERIEPLLQHAERAWQANDDRHKLGEVAQLQARLAWLRRDASATIDSARLALSQLAEDVRAGGLLALGTSQLLAGDLAAADTTLQIARTQCQALNAPVATLALYSQGELAEQRGQLSGAAKKYGEVIQIAGERVVWERWAAAIGLGDLARERNDLDRALALLESALTAAEQASVAVYLPHGYISLARTLTARQNFTAAEATLDRAAHIARRLGSPAHISQVGAHQARLALARGDLAAAEQWQATSAPTLDAPLGYGQTTAALTLVRVLIARVYAASTSQALGTARSMLEQLRRDAEAHEHVGSLIEILALAALAEAAAGRRDRALHYLHQALVLAAPAGYMRIFLDEGPPMAALLRADLPLLSAESSLRVYSQNLLAGFSHQPELCPPGSAAQPISRAHHAALVEALSDRELEVLRLIADGASNQAIAATLMISLGTVKSHINHILGKLTACNRTEAVARGRDLGLLTD